MNFKQHKRIIGFVVITLMGAGPLSALTETSKKKKPDSAAAVMRLPKTDSHVRTVKSSRFSKSRRRAHKSLKGTKKSSRKMLVKNKKAGSKVAAKKSVSKKRITGKRASSRVGKAKSVISIKPAKVAARTEDGSKTLPRTNKQSKTH
jgi:hypothetical protein